MKILIVGDWHSELHEEPLYNAFKILGCSVAKFSWHQYFKAFNPIDLLYKKIQNHFIFGPVIKRLNTDLIKVVADISPKIIFFYRGTHVTVKTLRIIKQRFPDIILVGYNNDDPFAKAHSYWLWRHFLRAVPAYDLMLAYRHHNLSDFRNIGAKRVELFRSWFFPERNYPIKLSDRERKKYECDVVFIGHYEADNRLEYIEEIARQGFIIRLFGPGYEWNKVLLKSKELKHLVPVDLVWGSEYNKALCGAKVALCFLSKHNRDTYTRRSFEIPATKTFMLSEYTDDLADLYKDGKEAVFFRSKKEMILKLKKYISNEKLRKEIARQGFKKVRLDGHDVLSRAKKLLELIQIEFIGR